MLILKGFAVDEEAVVVVVVEDSGSRGRTSLGAGAAVGGGLLG